MLLIFLGLVGVGLLLASVAPATDLTEPERALASRAAPAVFGVLTAVVVWTVWGSLRATAVYHDEAAYLFQARMFAQLRWAAPSPPLPEFFEQMYVLVTPVFAAKYPPGHALLMSLGAAAGMPGMVPVILNGVSGALTFALARRLAGVWVALLGWLLFVLAPNTLRFRASYFSEVTTGAMWLLALWSLLEWRATGRTRWILALAVAIGWGAITRPLTMLVLAVPIGAVVLRDVWRSRRWAQFAAAVGAGTAVLLILPLWITGTLGRLGHTPLAEYTSQYLPFDIPGYSMPATMAQRALPDDMRQTAAFLREIKAHQVAGPPTALLAERAGELFTGVWGDWRAVLFPAFLVGVATLTAAGWLALGSCAFLLLAYLTQAHTADWTIYYAETVPVLAFVTAAGFARIATWVASRSAAHRGATAEPGDAVATVPRRAALALLIVSLAVAALGARSVGRWREVQQAMARPQRTFLEQAASLPGGKTMVFVRYMPDHNYHFSLISNVPDLASAPVWLVHDRGADDLRLMRAAPDRKPWLYDEATRAFAEVSP